MSSVMRRLKPGGKVWVGCITGELLDEEVLGREDEEEEGGSDSSGVDGLQRAV